MTNTNQAAAKQINLVLCNITTETETPKLVLVGVQKGKDTLWFGLEKTKASGQVELHMIDSEDIMLPGDGEAARWYKELGRKALEAVA